MTDLRKMTMFRDLKVAMDFQKMAQNGFIDEEFTMYGCVYLKNGERRYLISDEELKVSEFVDNAWQQGYFPSPVETLKKICPVPAGEREKIGNKVKLDLARKLQEQYPKAFLQEFTSKYKDGASGEGKTILYEYVRSVQNSFSREKVEMATQLVNFAYEAKVLEKESFHALCALLHKEKEKMLHDIIAKDILNRTFYTLMYEKNGRVCYVTNARKEWAIQKKGKLRKEETIVAPIFSATYWYNHQVNLDQVKQMHEKQCKELLNEPYFALVKKLYQAKSQISREELVQYSEQTENQYGASCKEMVQFYSNKWLLQ